MKYLNIYDYLIMDDITINIPINFTSDFLGIMVIDILHDSQRYGNISGHRLSKIVDLLVESCILSNNEITISKRDLKQYIFKNVVLYMSKIWKYNLKAIGLNELPNFTENSNDYWQKLYKIVKIPLRQINTNKIDKPDTFIQNGSEQSIEFYNYLYQKDLLENTQAVNYYNFLSPKIPPPSNYFKPIKHIINNIQSWNEKSKISLDMKSSAGLLRTITDPIGYITNIATYTDPGYNMPGMSAIRKNVKNNINNFNYKINLQLENNDLITLFNVNYHTDSIIERSKILIDIFGETFNGSLPNSTIMANALQNYLNPCSNDLECNITIKDILEEIETLIFNYYDEICSTKKLDKIYEIYKQKADMLLFSKSLQNVYKSLFKKDCKNINEILDWVFENESELMFKLSFILSSIKMFYIYDIYIDEILLPEQLITKLLPDVICDYLDNNEFNKLAFACHQLKILQDFIGHPGKNLPEIPYKVFLADLLNNQWIHNRRGKLVNQILIAEKNWKKQQILLSRKYHNSICDYIYNLIEYTTGRYKDWLTNDNFLTQIPLFEISQEFEQGLTEQLFYLYPEIYNSTKFINRKGLLLGVMLNSLSMGKKSLIVLDLDLNLNIKTRGKCIPKREIIGKIIGKFTGDFGQIIWCINNEHIFASEDNNTSAMALFLHRLSINNLNKKWGSIHGLGDGSSVQIFLQKNN
jgi:hypothetical protein